jgi:phosphoesterase RecJ-like protein
MAIEEIAEIIRNNKSIAILPHVSADGDALASSLALGLALKKVGIESRIILEERIPWVYEFLPGREMSALYDGLDIPYDLVVALDTGDLNRLGKRLGIFKAANKTVNIDHHTSNTQFAELNYVSAESAAAGEIIYELIETMCIEIDRDIAICLYTAISSDTGGFKFSNTTPLTHRITARLIEKGLNIAEISRRIFDEVALEKVKLMGIAVNTLELLEDGRIAIIEISLEMMKKTGAKDEDCDGLVNIGRNIRGVEVSVVLREMDNNEVRVNLRSNEWLDVAEIAVRFSGGGHKRAAGCTLKGNVEHAKTIVVDEIKKAFDGK